jgi:hypothetical protein
LRSLWYRLRGVSPRVYSVTYRDDSGKARKVHHLNVIRETVDHKAGMLVLLDLDGHRHLYSLASLERAKAARGIEERITGWPSDEEHGDILLGGMA